MNISQTKAYSSSHWTYADQSGTKNRDLFVAKTAQKGTGWFHCEILRYNETDEMYRAVLFRLKAESNASDRNDLIEKIPREGFRFFDKPYTSDMFQSNVFRQPIGIPDTLLPESWRNRKSLDH